MAKNKLSKCQQRRVWTNHQRYLTSKAPEPDDCLFGERQQGRVISRFGLHADILADNDQVYRCHIRRTISSLVAGDRVVWRAASQTDETGGIVEAVHPRQSVLTRPDYYDGVKPIAANIDQVAIVSAITPVFSLNILDRYLVACHHLDIESLIVVNKLDLLDSNAQAQLDQQMSLYRDLGYRVLLVSSLQQQSCEALQQALNGRVSIFAGQSGVGKSSLLNALHASQQAPILTQEVSASSQLGQHTTTTAKLYFLPAGGEVIDSPGVREFGLWHLKPQQVIQGFVELFPYVAQCKYRDCRHDQDPGCAIRAALNRGDIASSRFENYHRILDSMAQVKARKGFPQTGH